MHRKHRKHTTKEINPYSLRINGLDDPVKSQVLSHWLKKEKGKRAVREKGTPLERGRHSKLTSPRV